MTDEQDDARGFGNEAACDNCGNEWGKMIQDGHLIYCEECWDEYDGNA